MEFDIKDLNSIITDLTLNKDIKLSDIPDLELYMDQVITLFDKKLSHFKRNEDDKILTKTMINNYTKNKILIPPIKKKYTKNHIILLSLIYCLKQSLSISDIGLLFKDIISKNDNLEIETVYKLFLNIKGDENDKLYESISKKINLIYEQTSDLDCEDTQSIRLLISVLIFINEANTYKRLAEKIIDTFFSDSKATENKSWVYFSNTGAVGWFV